MLIEFPFVSDVPAESLAHRRVLGRIDGVARAPERPTRGFGVGGSGTVGAMSTEPGTLDVLAPSPQRSTGQLGVIVFLASDVMLFAPFFAAYFLLRSTNQPWPPEGVEFDVPRAAVATIVLVASSFTLVAADRAHARADRVSMQRWLLVTIGLGAMFLANQFAEYATLSFSASDHPYGSIYWGLTGLHSAHVTAGLAALALLYVRAARSPSLDEISPWADGISLFWHLVDVVWVGVFTTIWIIR
jgi:cytochrome c oxidase subunit 3